MLVNARHLIGLASDYKYRVEEPLDSAGDSAGDKPFWDLIT
jgi:hypothetical protein